MDPALSSRFFRTRALYLLLVPLCVLALCQHFGQAVLGLLLMPLIVWPFAFRCRVDALGVRISWLIARERWNWDELESVALEEDRRWAVLGRRGKVLLLERRNGSRATLRGKTAVLVELASRIAVSVQQKPR